MAEIEELMDDGDEASRTLKRTDIPFRMRRETALLIGRLKTGKVGDVITAEELEAVAGVKVFAGDRGYGYLQSAKRYVTDRHGITWYWVTGAACLKCANIDEKIARTHKNRQSLAKQMRRRVRELSTEKIDGLSPDKAKEYLSTVAVAGTLAMVASNSAQKKLAARNVTKEIPLQKLLEAWK